MFLRLSRIYLSSNLFSAQEVARKVIWRSENMATSWNSSKTNSPTLLYIPKAASFALPQRRQNGTRENASRYLLENCCAIISGSPFPELALGQLYDQGVSPLDPRTSIEAKRTCRFLAASNKVKGYLSLPPNAYGGRRRNPTCVGKYIPCRPSSGSY